MTGAQSVTRRLLSTVWWIAFPLFLVLALRFSYERACLDPHELMRPIMQHQAGALVISVIYVSGYAWLIAATIITARIWNARAASGPFEAIWGARRFQMFGMAAAIALEQVPGAVWGWLYRLGGVC
jgi:hypothetical protein